MNIQFTYENLTDLLFPLAILDMHYPQIQENVDLFVYAMTELMGETGSFEDFKAECVEMRLKNVNFTRRSTLELALILLPVSELLKRSALAYPQIAKCADRVMYELLAAIYPKELPQKLETFDEFHKEHQMFRQIRKFSVQGVG